MNIYVTWKLLLCFVLGAAIEDEVENLLVVVLVGQQLQRRRFARAGAGINAVDLGC